MKQRYAVTVEVIYTDHIVVEAHSEEEARREVFAGADSWVEHDQDHDPVVRIVGKIEPEGA